MQILKILEGRKSGARDTFKLGLVVEGGGLRGVVSCAPLLVIDELGFTQHFDSVYATSAGAINAAYFLAGQIHEGAKIYSDGYLSKGFVSFKNWPHLMNLDFLFENVIKRQ